jgi:hypothetical protein
MGKENVEGLGEKYIVLELDTMMIEDGHEPVTAYCVLENLPITEMFTIKESRTLHEKLLENYRKKNWNFCQQAIEHLHGKWNRELDSFYDNILERIKVLESSDLDGSWDGIIRKNQSMA